MRVEEYVRELIGVYGVMGSLKSDLEYRNDRGCAPIKMPVTCPRITDSPMGYSLDELIRLADCDDFRSKHRCADDQEFCVNYAEIMRGNYPGWQLNAFKVYYGGITVYYGKPETGHWNFIWIADVTMTLCLTFETEKSRLGLLPTYNMRIDNSSGFPGGTEVEEDLGYLRRTIRFCRGNPSKMPTRPYETDNCCGSQYLEITECAGF